MLSPGVLNCCPHDHIEEETYTLAITHLVATMSLQIPHRDKANGAGVHRTKAVILVSTGTS